MPPNASSLPATSESFVLLALTSAFYASVHVCGREEILAQATVHVKFVFASACVSTATVWMRCRDRRAMLVSGDETMGAKDQSLRAYGRRGVVYDEGGDPDGVVMGSILIPLLLSASSCLSILSHEQEAALAACSNEGGRCSIKSIDSYALVASLSGFSFAVSSFLHTALGKLNKPGGMGFSPRLESMGLSVEILAAVLSLWTTFLFVFGDILRPTNDRIVDNLQASPSIFMKCTTCAVQAACLAWYQHGSTVLGSGTEVTTNLEFQPALSQKERQTNSNDEKEDKANSREATWYLNDIFTSGEWMAVSTILSIVFVDFFLRYMLPFDMKNELIPMPPYLAVSHSGLVGCLFGCAIFSLISQYSVGPSSKGQRCDERRSAWLLCSGNFFVVAGSTAGFVEQALGQSCAFYKHMCPLFGSSNTKLQLTPHSLTSLTWLGMFLSTPETNLSFLQISGFSSRQRWVWLVYWSIVMAALFPVTAYFAKKLKEIEDMAEKQICTVIARKFFHFVAVVLFLPATLMSPSMMTLSYAVASALLILIESLRLTAAPLRSCNEQLRPDQDAIMKSSWRSKLSVNDFYEAFFDEKDVGGKGGGFVVTHTALVCGCASPLWLREILFCQPSCNFYEHEGFDDSDRFFLIRLLPLVGVVALGIGDAAGALVGIIWGRTKWPGSKRSVEGSAAMILSMFLFLLCFDRSIVLIDNMIKVLLLLIALTAIEAFTSQIDNICLPIAGAVVLLIELILSSK